MVVRNETNDPVEYEQNGSGSSGMSKGTLEPKESKSFKAEGNMPYSVKFWMPKEDPTEYAGVSGIMSDDVEVTLTGFPVVDPL